MTIEHVTPAGGNIFADLGFPAQDAGNRKVRAALMVQIRRVMKDRQLLEVEAAELFGVVQPRISDLLNGKVDQYTIDTLVDMLTYAGFHVEVTVRTS